MPGKDWHSKALSERSAAYERAIELRGRGLALGEISRELGVGKDTIGAWCRGAKPRRIWRYGPDLAPCGDLAYLAGFYLGDGKYAGAEHKVRFELAEREQLEYVGGIVAKILDREPKPLGRDGTFYTVDYDSVVLSNFLDQDVEALVDYLKDFARDFLRGFFDAEGYVSARILFASKQLSSIVIGVVNTRLEYLKLVRDLLSDLKIFGHIRRTNKRGGKMTIRGKTWVRKRDVFHFVVIRRDSVVKFSESVGFRNGVKAQKLRDLISLIGKPPGERYRWFMAHYRKRGLKWVESGK